MTSKLFILTLTWNGIDKLTKLKDSLLPSLDGIDYNWLIKDNASTDNTTSIVSSWEGNIKCIPYKNNLQNFSQGTNLLFNEASPKDNDYILLLNNDVIFNDKTSIKKLIELMDKNSNIGAVGAKLLFTNTNKLQHAGVVFNNQTHAPAHFRLNQEADNNACKNRLFQAVTGAVLLTKAEYFKNTCYNVKSGNRGMDENYQWGFDDIDMCLAINHNMSKKILYCGETNIYHEDSASLKKAPTNKLFLNHNLLHLHAKWDGIYCLDQYMYDKDSKFNIYEK